MKKVIICCFTVLTTGFLHAQECSNYPADCPETVFIEQSQNREIRLDNDILPQEIDMQDKMRTLITAMMENAAKKLHWEMTELSEYTNEGGLQVAGTPYGQRSPRGIDITFRFFVNNDSLQAWKDHQSIYDKRYMNDISQDYTNIISTKKSPLYAQYKDSADYYLNLYTTYVEQHKDEGAALYTKDKHPAYYQKKQTEFLDKLTALSGQTHENSGIESKVAEQEIITRRFRNNTVVQVEFYVNNFTGIAIDQSLGPIESTSVAYPLPHAVLSKLYTVTANQTNESLIKWNNTILVLLGNFQTKPNDYGYYDAGFTHNGQGDEQTPKKIKSDKVQNISIVINGNKINIEKMANFIDVNLLNSSIVKQ